MIIFVIVTLAIMTMFVIIARSLAAQSKKSEPRPGNANDAMLWPIIAANQSNPTADSHVPPSPIVTPPSSDAGTQHHSSWSDTHSAGSDHCTTSGDAGTSPSSGTD